MSKRPKLGTLSENMCYFLFYWLLDEILENDERLLLVDMMLCDGGVGLKVFGLLGINL